MSSLFTSRVCVCVSVCVCVCVRVRVPLGFCSESRSLCRGRWATPQFAEEHLGVPALGKGAGWLGLFHLEPLLDTPAAFLSEHAYIYIVCICRNLPSKVRWGATLAW